VVRVALLSVLLVCAGSALAEAEEMSIGVLAGAQLLEQKSTALSHGPLLDEVTLGRTLLAGISLDLQLEEQHHIAIEIAAGPYRNDMDRSCVAFNPYGPCPPPRPYVVTRHAVLYGLHYSLALRKGRSISPFVGVGIGAKRYSYDDAEGSHGGGGYSESTGLALHGALGLEFAGKAPLRLEARVIRVGDNPYLKESQAFGSSTTQVELQVRASILYRFPK
jgi:hypothetical protein